MGKVKSMKKTIKYSVLAVILIIGGYLLYINVINPFVVKPSRVECINWDATYVSIKAFEESYNKNEHDKDTTVIHNFTGKLPSDNPKDYLTVYVHLQGNNRSFVEQYNMDGYISSIKNDDDIALWSYTLGYVVTNNVFRRTQKDATLILDLYVKDKSDEEIEDYIRSINIKMVYTGDILGKRETTISLSDVKDISVER